MIGTEDMPELTGLSFELHEAEPLQLGGTDVALESLSEEQLSALIERFTTALSAAWRRCRFGRRRNKKRGGRQSLPSCL